MPRRDSPAMWSAMRALYEGAQATPELLATISDRLPATIVRRANKEGWDAGSAAPRQARIRRLIDRVTQAVETIDIDGGPDAVQESKELIRAAGLLVPLLERLAGVAGNVESRKEAAKARDEQIGSVLERLNRRMVELARDYARQLVEREPGVADDKPQ